MFFKKKEKNKNAATEVKDIGIYVLGSGCKLCNTLETNITTALKTLNIDEKVFHIADFSVIASLGIMRTPALIIDKKIISTGKVLSEKECIDILKKERKI